MPAERDNGGKEEQLNQERVWDVPPVQGTGRALHSLEIQVLEGEVSLHDPCSFHSGPQHILLSRNVGRLGYSIQVI